MSKESEGFLDDFVREDEPAQQSEPQGDEAQSARARDDQGRFAKQQAEEAEEAEAEGEEQSAQTGEQSEAGKPALPPPGDKQKPDTVPAGVLAQMRKDFQTKIEALEQRLAQPPTPAPAQPQPAAAPTPPPDPMDDPQGFISWQQKQQEDAFLNERMNFSELAARDKHGDEKVDAALEAFKSANDPAAIQRVRSARHPYAELLKWHEEATTLSAVQAAGGLEAYIAQQVAARAGQQPAPAATPPAQGRPHVAPPPSLVKGGAGDTGSEALSEDEEFYAAFRK